MLQDVVCGVDGPYVVVFTPQGAVCHIESFFFGRKVGDGLLEWPEAQAVAMTVEALSLVQ